MEGEEWELCNDDGFIFKRRKRRQPEEVPQETPAEPEGEPRRNQLARRKISLLAVRERYRKEIEKLEGLAVSLLEDGRFCGAKDGGGGGDFGVTGEESTLERGAVGSISSYCNQKEGEDIAEPGNPFRALIEELMLQVGAFFREKLYYIVPVLSLAAFWVSPRPQFFCVC